MRQYGARRPKKIEALSIGAARRWPMLLAKRNSKYFRLFTRVSRSFQERGLSMSNCTNILSHFRAGSGAILVETREESRLLKHILSTLPKGAAVATCAAPTGN